MRFRSWWAFAGAGLAGMVVCCSSFEASAPVSPSDAGSDAALEASGADAGTDPPGRCSNAHFFCDDFDDGSFAKWKSDSGATITSESSTSAPNSAEFFIPAGMNERALQQDLVFGTLKRIECRFDLQIVEGGADEATIFGLDRGDTIHSSYGINIGFKKDETSLWEYLSNTPGTPTFCPIAVDDGKWHSVRLVIDYGVPASAELEVGGQLCTSLLLKEPTLPPKALLKIGGDFGGGTDGADVKLRFDSLACDVIQ